MCSAWFVGVMSLHLKYGFQFRYLIIKEENDEFLLLTKCMLGKTGISKLKQLKGWKLYGLGEGLSGIFTTVDLEYPRETTVRDKYFQFKSSAFLCVKYTFISLFLLPLP